MADVFISYHEESAGELAEQIADALDDAGISCWCARRDMLFGGNFAREIPLQIHQCRLFLLILNENVYQSEHIESEVGIAFSRLNKRENITIIPLEIGDFTRKEWAEYYLIHKQSVKIRQPDEKSVQKLVKRIAKILNHKPQAASLTQEQPATPTFSKIDPPENPPQPKPDPPSAKIIKRGECGDKVTYTLDENGVLTISGNGPMRDFEWDDNNQRYDMPWRDEREMISRARILNGVTSIGDFAFWNCAGLTSIDIPNSVTSIGVGAFLGCAGFASVDIPDSVTSIEDYAFADCVKLTSISISNSVTSIGIGSFSGCAGLISVNIPDSVIFIGDFSFYGCRNMTSVDIPNGVTFIGDFSFYGCTGLASVDIPNSVTSIGKGAFRNCVWLTSVKLSDGVTFIGDFAFWNCAELARVDIPDSVTSIGYAAFQNCAGLKSVDISDGVISIGNYAFFGCEKLKSVSVPAGVTIRKYAFPDTTQVTRRPPK